MTSLRRVIAAAPKPALLVQPPEVSNAAVEAIELAASAGLDLDPWQQLALRASLGETDTGKWAATRVGVIVPRQNGKGACIEARELAGLFLFGERTINHTAHLFKTAADAFERITGLIENTPDLLRRTLYIRRSHGEERIRLRSGAELKFLARSASSGRGLGGDLLILDEAYHLPAAVMGAIQPTLSARVNHQLWFTSSPPVEEYAVEGRTLRRLRCTAESADPGRLAWVEYSNPSGVDPTDRKAWARANPNLGTRLSISAVEDELDTLEPAIFEVERLGVWTPDPDQDIAAAIPLTEWEACEHADAAPSDPITFAFDVAPNRNSASIVAVGDWHGHPCVELVEQHSGTEWLVDRLGELCETWDYTAVAFDSGSAAGSFQPQLERLGIRLAPEGTAGVKRAAGRLYDSVASGQLAHWGQPEMAVAVGGAKKRDIGDAWAFGRRSSAIDITPVVATSLALITHEDPPELPAELLEFVY